MGNGHLAWTIEYNYNSVYIGREDLHCIADTKLYSSFACVDIETAEYYYVYHHRRLLLVAVVPSHHRWPNNIWNLLPSL